MLCKMIGFVMVDVIIEEKRKKKFAGASAVACVCQSLQVEGKRPISSGPFHSSPLCSTSLERPAWGLISTLENITTTWQFLNRFHSSSGQLWSMKDDVYFRHPGGPKVSDSQSWHPIFATYLFDGNIGSQKKCREIKVFNPCVEIL